MRLSENVNLNCRYDICMLNSEYYKRLAKSSYLCLLGLGISVTVLSTFKFTWSRFAVIALSLATSILVSMLSYSNPPLRWRHLRSCACRCVDVPVFLRTCQLHFLRRSQSARKFQVALFQIVQHAVVNVLLSAFDFCNITDSDI